MKLTMQESIGLQVAGLIDKSGLSTYALEKKGIRQEQVKAIISGGNYTVKTLCKLLGVIGGEIRIEG